MKKTLLFFAIFAALPVFAQTEIQNDGAQGVQEQVIEDAKVLKDEVIEDYRRSSLYSVLLEHPEREFSSTIDSVFFMMPTPDKFNDHNLWTRKITSTATKAKKIKAEVRGTEKDPNIADIRAFIEDNGIAREMVAKWFNRNSQTGLFDTELVKERGLYDASFEAIENAAETSEKSRVLLENAGEDLIGKTFMTVNDITFIDHGENSAKASKGIKNAGAILGALASLAGQDDLADLATSSTELVGDIANEVAGYKVNIITYLYRLDWNQDVMNQFYTQYWMEGDQPDQEKKKAFDTSDLFTISYVGHTATSAENISSKTFALRPRSEQFLRACTRAVDKAIVELQREYDEFKVNVPIYKVNEDGTVDVKIGLKEGVNKKSRYEVLMKQQNKDGVIEYKKVGLIAPVEDKIWDNRFGAAEELEMLKADKEAAAADSENAPAETAEAAKAVEDESGNPLLGATTFKVIEGQKDIMPGLLTREVKIAREKKK